MTVLIFSSDEGLKDVYWNKSNISTELLLVEGKRWFEPPTEYPSKWFPVNHHILDIVDEWDKKLCYVSISRQLTMTSKIIFVHTIQN